MSVTMDLAVTLRLLRKTYYLDSIATFAGRVKTFDRTGVDLARSGARWRRGRVPDQLDGGQRNERHGSAGDKRDAIINDPEITTDGR